MIKNIRFKFILLTIVFSAFWKLPVYSQIKFEISGFIDNSVYFDPNYNIKDGDLLTLKFINCERIDSTFAAEGKFHFNGDIPIPSVAIIHHKNGGLLLLLDESLYQVTLAIEEVEPGRYHYGNRVETESKFYNLWKTLSLQKGDLMATKKEIQSRLNENLIEAERSSYLSELEQIDIKLSNLYKDASIEYNSTYEMTYLLPAAPDFSYTRYIEYYDMLPLQIKNSYYGEYLYKKLLQTKPE